MLNKIKNLIKIIHKFAVQVLDNIVFYWKKYFIFFFFLMEIIIIFLILLYQDKYPIPYRILAYIADTIKYYCPYCSPVKVVTEFPELLYKFILLIKKMNVTITQLFITISGSSEAQTYLFCILVSAIMVTIIVISGYKEDNESYFKFLWRYLKMTKEEKKKFNKKK